MSERSRKKARREARQAQQVPQHQRTRDVVKPAPLSSQRNKFRVAAANREIASELPGVIRQRTGEKLAQRRAVSLDPAPVAPSPPPSQPRAVAKPARPQRSGVRLDGPKLDQIDPGKCRPKDNTPKSGGGSSRDFHLWKKTC